VRVARSIGEYAEIRQALDAAGPRRIAYVPTMGALHAGHRSLLRLARTIGDVVVVSIFVNPLQFGPDEDYARYPRNIDDDLRTCEAEGVDVVFVPSVLELYPAGRQVTVNAGAIGAVLEGQSRPGHFDGVLTVVLKLFNILGPDVAIFGQKDAQQLACIQRMVIDLNLPVEIVGAPTVRESDGLAVSSRNVFLGITGRQIAAALSTALHEAALRSCVPSARAAAMEVLDRAAQSTAFDLDYATLVNPATFSELPDDYTGPGLFVVAARVGSTRLIDNASMVFAPVEAVADC